MFKKTNGEIVETVLTSIPIPRKQQTYINIITSHSTIWM